MVALEEVVGYKGWLRCATRPRSRRVGMRSGIAVAGDGDGEDKLDSWLLVLGLLSIVPARRIT